MSSFICGECGRSNIDVDSVGYVSGCSHHPPEHKRFVTVYFGGHTPAARAFYDGAWYKSKQAKARGLAIHPVAWEEEAK